METPLVYIHIGIHKTGTCSIQRFLSRNRKMLLEKGVLYPESCRWHRDGWLMDGCHNAVCEIIKDHRFISKKDIWKDLHKEIRSSKARAVIISSECFVERLFGIEQIKALRKKLSKNNVKIIVYLRRQDSLLVSMYKYWIKHGNCAENIISVFQKMYAGGAFDYYKLLENWSKVFGKENIIVKIFEEQIPRSLINSFFEVIGEEMPSEIIKSSKHVNRSYSVKITKFIRFLNLCMSPLPSKYKNKVGLLYRLALRNKFILKLVEKIPDFFIKDKLLTKKERNDIMMKFKRSNDKIAREYLGRDHLWRNTV